MGKYKISAELINQIEILLHKESGTSKSINRLPSSPSIIRDSISAVGSNSEDSLRCNSCNGELLRGSDSIICVFCGRFPDNLPECSSDPICFTDTLGFRCFLGSLSLDGSESVERPVKGGNESGRGRDPVKNEIPLSAVLDLQLKWPDASNRFGVENGPDKQSAKFVGLNFDELFQTEGIGEGVYSSLNEQNVGNKKIEIKEETTFAGQSSLSLFENSQTGSRDVEDDESDWAAEFQSANADVNFDSGFQMDSTQQPPKQEDSANIPTFQTLPADVSGSKSQPSFGFKQSESDMIDKDGQMGLGPVDATFDWLPAGDNQVIADKNNQPHHDKLDGDSSNNWDEFGVFSGAVANQVKPVSGGGFEISDSWNDFTGSVGAGPNHLQTNLDVDKPVYGVGDDFALFGHVSIEQQNANVESMLSMTTNLGESLGVQGTSKEVDDSVDLSNDYKNSDNGDNIHQQLTSKEAPVGKLSPAVDGTFNVENDNSFDVWSDFAQSTGILNSKPISSDTSFEVMGDFSSMMVTQSNPAQSNETKAAENLTAMQDGDDFGSWSDFRSSWKQPDSSFSERKLDGSMQDSIISGRDVDNLPSVKDKNSQNSWGDIGWSTSVLEQPSHAVEALPSESKLTSEDRDLFLGFEFSDKQSSLLNNQLKSNGTAVQNGKSTSGNDEDIDTWTDFVSTTNKQPSNLLSNNVETDVIQEPVLHDPFGEWNVIGSTPNKESGSVTAVANENFPQVNQFSSNADSQFVGSNSSMHQDPFLFMLNDQNGSSHVASSRTEVPNLVGTEHQDAIPGDFDNKSETAFMEQHDQKKSDVVENLISEMHDLSFMLESGLSIPKPGT